MERIYFSKNNFNVIYNIIGEKIFKKYSFDISDDDKFENKMLDLMKSIYKQKNDFNIDFNQLTPQSASNELSKKVLDIVYGFFSNYIHSILTKPKPQKQIDTKENRIDIRAESSNKTTLDDVNKRYEELQNERYSMLPEKKIDAPIFTDNTEESSINVNKQYELLSNTRNNELQHDQNIKLDIVKSEKNITQNNLLPINDNDTLEAQFGLITDNMDELKQKFEETSVEDRLKEYEKMRTDTSFIQPDEITSTSVNEMTPFPSTSMNEMTPFPSTSVNEMTPFPSTSVNENILFPEKSINDNGIELNKLNDFFKILENKKENTYIKRKYNIVINSIDRQWWGVIDDNDVTYESSYIERYKYVVNFAPVSDTSVRVPIYENNKFIPPNLDELNTTGFTIKTKTYDAYDPTKPKGNIEDYITTIFKGGNDGISINNSIRNVVSVKLKRLIMPNNDISQSVNITDKPISEQHIDSLLTGGDPSPTINVEPRYSNYYRGFKSEPYLFVHMEGYDSNIITSNHFNKSIFAKPHFDKEFRYNSDTNSCSYISRGWSYFKNEDGDFTEFRPAPLSEITKLSIELLRPDGSLYSHEKDNLEVTKIEFYNTDSTTNNPDFLKLTLSGGDTNGWVSDNYFNNGDKIIVKNIKWLDSYWNDDIKNIITEYLNKGAHITRWNDDTDEYSITKDRLINTILIMNPLLKLNNTGILEWNTIYGSYNDISVKSSSLIGFLINYNLQHSLILEIETEETKNNIVSEII